MIIGFDDSACFALAHFVAFFHWVTNCEAHLMQGHFINL
jgi:hypothetical protein